MSLFGSFDRTKHFEELASPLDTQGEGVISAATRRGLALTNLAGATMTAAELTAAAGVTAGTAAASKSLVLDANKGVGNFRNTSSPRMFVQAAPAAKTTSVTLTAAEVIAGLITGNQGAGAAADYTLPLASALETALLVIYPGLQVNDAFDFTVINISTTAADVVSLLTNTGWTLVGDMTMAANGTGDQSVGTFRARRTAANTYTLYRL